MVKLHIIVEGGIPPENVSAQTANNVESLRQAFHELFSRILCRDDLSIVVRIGYANRNAIKMFVADDSVDCLFVDSDSPVSELSKWFENLAKPTGIQSPLSIPEERSGDVYFMIQEMEAWFLKQPDCIEKWASDNGYSRRNSHKDEDIADYRGLKDKDVEAIRKPSELLATIVQVFFEKRKNGKRLLAKYCKLKTAPAMLNALDVNRLVCKDTELLRFKSKFS